MFDRNVYVQRRSKLKQHIGSGVILFLGNENSSMNYADNLYPFRQDSTFLYFFGIDRPALAALIDIELDKEIIFGDDLTVEQMVWTGYQRPLAEQAENIGITLVKPLGSLTEVIGQARKQNRHIHFLPCYRPEQEQTLNALFGTNSAELRSMVSVSLIKAIVAERSVKSEAELAEIENAVNATIDIQLEAMSYAKEGM